MDKRECEQTLKAIQRALCVEVTGVRVERGRVTDYIIDCRDTVSGYPFAIRSREDWDMRRAQATR